MQHDGQASNWKQVDNWKQVETREADRTGMHRSVRALPDSLLDSLAGIEEALQ